MRRWIKISYFQCCFQEFRIWKGVYMIYKESNWKLGEGFHEEARYWKVIYLKVKSCQMWGAVDIQWLKYPRVVMWCAWFVCIIYHHWCWMNYDLALTNARRLWRAWLFAAGLKASTIIHIHIGKYKSIQISWTKTSAVGLMYERRWAWSTKRPRCL